jgi:hypothetical protein
MLFTVTETTELRGAVRFPLRLPVSFLDNGKVSGDAGWTENISAGGVLIHCGTDYPVGSTILFMITMPADTLGAEKDVQVECVGRVVRCTPSGDHLAVGTIIDEYRIAR